MSSKTVLQQLMGGTSDVKENFLPGMGDIYSNIKGGDEFGEGEGEGEGDNKKKEPVVKAAKSATKQASKSATKPVVVKPAAAAPAVGSNVIGATPVTTPGTTQQTSNTGALMAETQSVTTNKILVFVIHVIFAIIIAYVWGILGSNALFLITRSKNEKEYILPTYRYGPPYCITENKNASYFSYGFPYNLLPRICTNNNVSDVINTEKENIYLLDEVEEGGVGNGVSQALFNYLFNSVYGGLGQGARSLAQAFLNLFDTTDSGKADNENSWDNMQVSGGRKFLVFILFPFIVTYLIFGLGLVAAIGGLIFGIISDHPFWGLIFTLFFGIFIAFGNGIWMAIQSVYIFCLYPCLNIKNKEDYDKVFNNMRPYMLLVFYILIALYAFQDLGNSGGAGIIFFIIVAYFTGNAT
jgi:hypothetical protein